MLVVTRARLVYHRSFFKAMGMYFQPEIWQLKFRGCKKFKSEVAKHVCGDQGQVGVPQEFIKGHGDVFPTPNLAIKV